MSGPSGGPGRRVALVVVSHSRPLADAAVELALQMVAAEPPVIEVAAGASDGGLGTDAVAVAEAVARADVANGGAGVLVLTDLGSAVLSAEMALELVDPAPTGAVLLSRAPLVEGLVAAAVQAAVGASLDGVEREAVRAVSAKSEHLGPAVAEPAPDPDSDPASDPVDGERSGSSYVDVEVVNAQGLHARPAARFVAAAAALPVEVQVANLTTGAGPVAAASMLELMTLGASRGDLLRLSTDGDPAALESLRALVADGLGDG